MVGTFPIRGMASRPRLRRRRVVLIPPPAPTGGPSCFATRSTWSFHTRCVQFCAAACGACTTFQCVCANIVWRLATWLPSYCQTRSKACASTLSYVSLLLLHRWALRVWVCPDQPSFQQVVGSIGTFDLSALVAWLVNTVVLMGVSRFVADVVAFNFLSESERCAMHACAGVRRGGGSNERHGM